MYLTFSFPHLPQFDQISSLDESSFLLILLNLNDLSWNLMSFVSLMNQHSLTTWWKFLHSLLPFFFMLVSFLSWWPSLFAHSLMFSQSLISPWWISFLPSFDEVKYPFFWWTLFSKLDELFIGLIVFIEDLTKWCWIHKVNTSSSRNIKHAYLISPTKV